MTITRRTVVAGLGATSLGAAIGAPHIARAQEAKHYRFGYD